MQKKSEFRANYSQQLRGKKQQVYDSQMGHNALEEKGNKLMNRQWRRLDGEEK